MSHWDFTKQNVTNFRQNPIIGSNFRENIVNETKRRSKVDIIKTHFIQMTSTLLKGEAKNSAFHPGFFPNIKET